MAGELIWASDEEREQAAAWLREHGAAGRLTIEELTSRLETALGARTRAELGALFADLPAESPSHRGAAAKRHGVQIHAQVYVLVCLGMIALWAATGLGYFWPIWPILGWGIGLFSHRSGGRPTAKPCGAGHHRPSSRSCQRA